MKFRFAVIGDSLAQGYQHGSVGNTEWSFPAILARALGLRVGSDEDADFRVPPIPGSGLPVSLTGALGAVRRTTGDEIRWWEWLPCVPLALRAYLLRKKAFYDGPGALPAQFAGVYHNLGMYGLMTHETYALTPGECNARIEAARSQPSSLLPIPGAARHRVARMVLDPAHQDWRLGANVLDNLQYLVHGHRELRREPEPLDALIVWIGSNDCLQTVVELALRDMPAEGVPNDAERERYNLTSVAQFGRDFDAMAERIDRILDGTRTLVYVGNIPDITIPPIAKGLGKVDEETGLFDHYGRFFLDDDEWHLPFKTLSFKEARIIQSRIAAYNAHIEAVAEARGWKLVDAAKTLSLLAVRRNDRGNAPSAETARDRMVAYAQELRIDDHPLLRVGPTPSVLMLKTDSQGRRVRGGLTSIDGVHPSTIGYGIAAEGFLKRIQVDFPWLAHATIPWRHVISQDRVLVRPPAVWDDFRTLLSLNKPGADLLFRFATVA